jgi:hypothetical protein
LLATALLSRGDLSTDSPPSLKIVRNEIVCRERFHPRSQSGLYTYGSMDDQSRNGSTPSRSPTLRSSHRAKRLLEAIVGPWQVSDLVAEKQMRSITAAHLEEMSNGLGEGSTQLGGMLLHMQQHELETQFSLCNRKVIGFIKDVGKLMDPPIDT